VSSSPAHTPQANSADLPENLVSAETSARVSAEQLSHIAKMMRSDIVVIPLWSVALMYIFTGGVPELGVAPRGLGLLWVAAMVTSSLITLGVLIAYSKLPHGPENSKKWVATFALLHGFIGALWGSAVWLLWVDDSALNHMALACVIIGLTATLALQYIPHFAIYAATVVSLYLVIVPRFALAGSGIGTSFAIVMPVFLVWMLSVGRGACSRLAQNIRHRIQGEATEQALADSEERLSFALRGSNDGLWDWNLETGETYYSPRWSEMIGFEDNELSPDTDAWDGLLHPDDRPLVDEYMTKCLEGEVVSYEIEFRFRHKDGHYVDILSRGFAVPDEDGQVRRLVGVNSDISARKRTEAALLESEEKFRAMIENTTDNITIFDRENNYKYVSPSVVRTAGMDLEQAAEIIGSPVHNVVHRDDIGKVRHAIRQAWRQPGETVFLSEYRAILPGGADLHLEALVTALPNVPGVDGVVINSRDISARKKAETDLTIAKNEAEAASMAKSQFLSSMSHELRTPMNAILGFSQLLDQDSVEPLSQRHQEFVDEILRSGHHMLELIGDVLDLAKIESDDISFDMEVQSPRPLIETCLTMIAASADQKGIDIQCQYPKCDLPLIKVDALRFKQALLNLLSNAVKYNRPDGRVTLECNSGANGIIHVSVSDNGPGIPEDLRDKVFEPFDRLGAEASDTPGTGIGLTVTKQLVELMGGSVGFESTVGEGTTFWINLPVASATPQPAV
jgi:PAS domain S-box-containing protein